MQGARGGRATKSLKERARGSPETRNPTDHTQRPSVPSTPRLAAPGKHCASTIDQAQRHLQCRDARRFFFGGQHRPSKHPRSTHRTQRGIHYSVEFGAHTKLPRTGRRWEQGRRGRGRAGPSGGRTMYVATKERGGEGGLLLLLLLLLRSSEAAVGQSAR